MIQSMTRKVWRVPALIMGVSLVGLTGCSEHFMRDTVAGGMRDFNYDYSTPWFLASEDTDVMCAMGEGMGGMVYPMGPEVDPLVPMLSLASGMCADEKSKEAQLEHIRAMRRNDTESAQDALTRQQRWLAVAAKRQYFGYQSLIRAYGNPTEGCPEFKDDNYEFSYLNGLLNGLQAFQSDFASGGKAGVPNDTPSQVMAGLKCVDSDKYWGLPNAILAMTDITLAAAGGDSAKLQEGYDKVEKAAKVGEKAGVRMVHALQAQMYMMQSKPEEAKQVVRNHVNSIKRTASNPDYRLMDLMATRNVRAVSDLLWTRETGKRTPYGKFGTFAGEKPKLDKALNIDELL